MLPKFLIILTAIFSLAFACHSSCNCLSNSNVCDSCKFPGASVDQYHRFCPCPSGFFVSNLTPYQCTQNINLNSTNQDISQQLTACQIESSNQVKNLKINSNSNFTVENNASFVYTLILLDSSSVALLPECLQEFSIKLQYNNTKNNTYEDVQLEYLLPGNSGELTVKYPLIYLYDISDKNVINSDNQIQQTVHFLLTINNTSTVIRKHYFDLVILTDRGIVETFTFDIGLSETSGCQNNEDCVIIADLDTNGVVCETIACDVLRSNQTFSVGDTFIAKVSFADPTYTKILDLVSLYLKNDQDKIYNFTAITASEWVNNGVIIQLPLVEPTNSATIQINLQVKNQSVLRRILNEDNVITKSQFSAQIQPADQLQSQQQQSSNENSSKALSFLLSLLLAKLILLL